jgi:hypothetical protein
LLLLTVFFQLRRVLVTHGLHALLDITNFFFRFFSFWILQIDLKEDLLCELLQNELWSDSKTVISRFTIYL